MRAVVLNCTLKKSPDQSNTDLLAQVVPRIFRPGPFYALAALLGDLALRGARGLVASQLATTVALRNSTARISTKPQSAWTLTA